MQRLGLTEDENLIKALGRWHSSAFTTYLKDQQISIEAADAAGRAILLSMIRDGKKTKKPPKAKPEPVTRKFPAQTASRKSLRRNAAQAKSPIKRNRRNKITVSPIKKK